MEKKHKKKNLSRDRILTSALKVIGTKGMSNLTHRSVAAEAKVAHSTVSYYFRTVDDIAIHAFKKIRVENQNFLGESSLPLIDIGKKLTPLRLFQLAAERSQSEFDSGYVLQAEQELLLYSSNNEELCNQNNTYVNKNIASLNNFLKAHGFKNPNSKLIYAFWVGYEKCVLEQPELFKFSDAADLAMQIVKTFKK